MSLLALKLARTLFWLAIFFMAQLTSSFAQAEPQSSTSTELTSIEALKFCLVGADSAACLDKIFREVLKTEST